VEETERRRREEEEAFAKEKVSTPLPTASVFKALLSGKFFKNPIAKFLKSRGDSTHSHLFAQSFGSLD